MEKDIPFLHCSLRLSRNWESYWFRIFLPIFVITLNSTFVFRFDSDSLSDRLNYLITNLLAVITYFYIVAGYLPQMSYLTLIDQYMISSLVFVGTMTLVCVLLDYIHIDPSTATNPNTTNQCVGTKSTSAACLQNTATDGNNMYMKFITSTLGIPESWITLFIETEKDVFIFMFMFSSVVIVNILFSMYCSYARKTELKKLTMSRHEVDVAEYVRLSGQIDSQDEFLVHTYIHPEKTSVLVNGSTRPVFEGKHVYEGTAARTIDRSLQFIDRIFFISSQFL